MLDLARQNVPEAEFRQCDVLDMDASFGRFDAVTGFFSLLVLPREQLRSVLETNNFTVSELRKFTFHPVATVGVPEVQLFLYCRRM